MKKYFILIIAVFIFLSCSQSAFSNNIDEIIQSSPLYQTSIVSVSVRDTKTGNVIYEKDSKLLLHPASTLKAFIAPFVLAKLGKDYKVTTSFYIADNNLYIKLAGDPLLTTSELNKAISAIKLSGINKFNSIIIDDSAVDKTEWGKGWMSDDENSIYIPKYSVYNINHNLIKAKNGNLFPTKNPEQNFNSILKNILILNNVKITSFSKGVVPDNAKVCTSISHSISEEIKEMLYKSDNLTAESLFKLAVQNKKGSTLLAIKDLKLFYSNMGLPVNNIDIVDASGVSHYNLLQTDWMSLALSKLINTDIGYYYVNLLATPGVGTLNERFLNSNLHLSAKTGTLHGMSGLTGFVKGNSGNVYSFAILIQNYIGPSDNAKILEDNIVKSVSEF